MISKQLNDVQESDLVALISNAVAEGKTIDYKQALPGNSAGEKKEFLADVSSFSNTSGGDLIFGMAEAQGVPTGITGVQSTDIDLELRRFDSIIADGLEPRIRYAAKVVDSTNSAKVIIIRAERSWNGPHRVIFKGHDKFYGRNSAGKYPLDVAELRTAFTLSATVTERIVAFRTDRIIALSNNQTPIPFTPEPKIIIHCIPIGAVADPKQYDVLRYDRTPGTLEPFYHSGWSTRINLNGVVSYSGNNPAFSYTQVYRNGIIEAVTGGLLAHDYNGKRVIPSLAYEQAIYRYLPKCFKILNELGCPPPIVVALSFTGTKGLEMGVDNVFGPRPEPIDEDTLVLPETVVEDFNMPIGKILKPMLDLVWNAAGYPESKNFDANGNWVGR